MRNGVYRTTHPHRLDDTAELLVRHLRRDATRVRILDVGCSSGISTVELHEALTRANIDAETFGSDLEIGARYVKVGEKLGFLFDDDWRLVQVELDERTFAPELRRHEARREPGRWMLSRCAVLATPIVRRLARRGVIDSTSFSLVAPEARAARRVSILRENILAPVVAGSFDVIRAANILNRGYFHESELRRMIRALTERLTDPGYLLVARTTDEEKNLATLFRREGSRFTVVERLNGGCEIEHLVVESERSVPR